MNFELTARAMRMLQRGAPGLRRNNSTLASIAEIEEYLRAEGCPLSHPIIEFQRKLGGSQYYIRFALREVISLGLDLPPFAMQRDGMWYCICGEWGLAQYNLYMDEIGVIYADEDPLASSMGVFIESDSLEDALMDVSPSWLRAGVVIPRLVSVTLYERLASAGMSIAAEASDQYRSWWANETIAVSERPYLDGKRDKVIVQGNSLSASDMRLLGAITSEWGPLNLVCEVYKSDQQCEIVLDWLGRKEVVTDRLLGLLLRWSNFGPRPELWITWEWRGVDLFDYPRTEYPESADLHLEIAVTLTPAEIAQVEAVDVPGMQPLGQTYTRRIPIPRSHLCHAQRIAEQVFGEIEVGEGC